MATTVDLVKPGSGAMFDAIAPRYDLLNRVISLGLDRRWRTRAARSLHLRHDARVLDLATGTGDLAITLARCFPTARIDGVDPSERMLEVGARKLGAHALTDRVALSIGDAQSLRFEDATFDAVTIAFGIRNVPDRERALREMRRVLRAGGEIAVLELAEPKAGLLGPLARWHVHHVVPTIGAWLSGAREYDYLQSSITRFPEPAVFATMLERAGFSQVTWSSLTFGAATLYVGVA